MNVSTEGLPPEMQQRIAQIRIRQWFFPLWPAHKITPDCKLAVRERISDDA